MTTKTTKHYISDNILTFTRPGEKRRTVTSASSIFPAMAALLRAGEYTGQSKAEMLGQLFEGCGTEFLPKGALKDRIKNIEKENLPTAPFVTFMQGLKEDIANDILSFAGTINAPLTFDGKLIAYARANWLHNGVESPWANEFGDNEFIELNSGGNQTFKVGSFDYIANQCSDTGQVYEILVNAKDIMSVTGSVMQVKNFVRLGALGTSVTSTQKAAQGVMVLDTNAINMKGYCLRVPETAAQLAAAVNELYGTGYNQIVSAKSVRRKVRQTVSCGR